MEDERESRKRRRSDEEIRSFASLNHSLRIPVSSVAAMAGFHPYKDLVQLMISMVYQGSRGQELMARDAAALGLSLTTDEELWARLVDKAGDETRRAFREVLAVQTGEMPLSSIQQATRVKEKLVTAAFNSSKLSNAELQLLREASRSLVDTGFGTHHEDDALDQYERMSGWEVRDRNAEIREWRFALEGTVAAPIRDAASRAYHGGRAEEGKISSGSSEPDLCNGLSLRGRVIEAAAGDEEPFFVLSGSIDGLRDELVPVDGQNGIDQDWELRSVVVECKHRLNRLQAVAPLYEHIQATIYCLMYQTNRAEIVQVLRRSRTKLPQAPEKPADIDDAASSDRITSESTIVVNRLDIDDPVMKHRDSWESIVLPRLVLFVKAVYKIRTDESLRYRLLLTTAEEVHGSPTAWQLLHELMPWLRSCDTVFQRQSCS